MTGLTFDAATGILKYRNDAADLSDHAGAILAALAAAYPRPVTRADLIAAVWPINPPMHAPSALANAILRLRRGFEQIGLARIVHTGRGSYRLLDDVRLIAASNVRPLLLEFVPLASVPVVGYIPA